MKKRLSNKVYLITFYVCLAASYSCRGKASTTIGARELNYCVRYGNRCDLSAITTRQTFSFLKMYPCTSYKFYALKNSYKGFSFENIYKGFLKCISLSHLFRQNTSGYL